jgi:hypothetical protein
MCAALLYLGMLNSVYTTIFTEASGEIDIQIVAEHPGTMVDFNSAGIYSLWNSEDEPLGLFTRSGDELVYEGTELSEDEYQQLALFIAAYREGDWDL